MENAIMVAAALIGAGITMGLAAIGAGLVGRDWELGEESFRRKLQRLFRLS